MAASPTWSGSPEAWRGRWTTGCTAQKLLVLKQDKSTVSTLKTIVRARGNQLARILALWTLEGLNALDAPLARELMNRLAPTLPI
jgi:hypothetical protein